MSYVSSTAQLFPKSSQETRDRGWPENLSHENLSHENSWQKIYRMRIYIRGKFIELKLIVRKIYRMKMLSFSTTYDVLRTHTSGRKQCMVIWWYVMFLHNSCIDMQKYIRR